MRIDLLEERFETSASRQEILGHTEIIECNSDKYLIGLLNLSNYLNTMLS